MNEFREWLSDNLRYILLLLGILAVLCALFFGVRALTGIGKDSGNIPSEENASGPDEEVAAAESAVAEEPQVTEAARAPLAENADPQVSKLISDYYAALSARDVAAVRTLTDTLPEADAVGIESSVTQYSDVKVYTKEGLQPGSLVAFVSYRYQNENQPAPLPGLTQMLVKKAADGSWKIALSEQDAETKAYIEALTKDADVQALIAQVTKEYEEAEQAMTAASSSGDAGAAVSKTESGNSGSGDASAAAAPDGDGGSAEEGQNDAAPSDEQETAPAEEAGTEAADEPENAAPAERTAEVLSSCNVRSGPGYDYQILGEVRTGSYVTVIGGLEDGWWHIRTDYLDGYVGGKFLPEA